MSLLTFVTVSFMLFSLPFSRAVLADSLDLNLSGDDAQFVYGRTYRSAETTAGALYASKSKNGNTDSHWAGHLGLIATGEQRSATSRTEAGVGARLYFASAESKDALALALGGAFRWFPGEGPIGLGAYGFIAPDIVTGLDAKRLWEAGARVEFEAVRGTASVYLGYRKMEMRLDNDANVTVDKGGHVGVRIVF
jgi:hypothetical protein